MKYEGLRILRRQSYNYIIKIYMRYIVDGHAGDRVNYAAKNGRIVVIVTFNSFGDCDGNGIDSVSQL